MGKLIVKLRDTNSIFRDAAQDITITGKTEVEVELTKTINEAVRGGALVAVSTVKETKQEEETKQEVDEESKDEDEVVNGNGFEKQGELQFDQPSGKRGRKPKR